MDRRCGDTLKGLVIMERTRFGWERWLAVAGIGYVVAHFVFLTSGSAGPDLGVSAVQRAFAHSATTEMRAGLVYQVSALLLLLFAVSLRAHLRPAESEPKTLSSVVLGTAFASVVLAFVGSAMLFVAESSVAKLGDANLTYSLMQVWWATLIGYLLLLGIVAIAASASALITRMFPRWIGLLGIVCGLVLAGGCLAFYPSGAVVQGPADSAAYLGEILFAVWAIAASITILRGRRIAQSREVSELRMDTVSA